MTTSAYRQALQALEPRETFMVRVHRTITTHKIPAIQLAFRAGVCPTQLSRWFNERSVPSLESMLRVEEALQSCLYEDGAG